MWQQGNTLSIYVIASLLSNTIINRKRGFSLRNSLLECLTSRHLDRGVATPRSRCAPRSGGTPGSTVHTDLIMPIEVRWWNATVCMECVVYAWIVYLAYEYASCDMCNVHVYVDCVMYVWTEWCINGGQCGVFEDYLKTYFYPICGVCVHCGVCIHCVVYGRQKDR